MTTHGTKKERGGKIPEKKKLKIHIKKKGCSLPKWQRVRQSTSTTRRDWSSLSTSLPRSIFLHEAGIVRGRSSTEWHRMESLPQCILWGGGDRIKQSIWLEPWQLLSIARPPLLAGWKESLFKYLKVLNWVIGWEIREECWDGRLVWQHWTAATRSDYWFWFSVKLTGPGFIIKC